MRVVLTCLLAMFATTCLAAPPVEAVLCHYTYGGEERTLLAHPVDSPYGVEPIAVGSYFQLRVVFQKRPADVAGIHIYTYADREPTPVMIHQASFPYPPQAQRGRSKTMPYGFTGRQTVFEPVRDGELQYWCAWQAAR
jgi:hypothetical protein